MAKQTFYLRPSEDISVEHIYSGEAAYLLLSEEVADGNSTVIKINIEGSGSYEYSSAFKLSGDVSVSANDFYCTGMNLTINVYYYETNMRCDATSEVIISINGTEIETIPVSSGSISYQEHSYLLSENSVNYINNYVKNYGVFPEVTCVLHDVFSNAKVNESDTKSPSIDKCWTQVYIAVNYIDDIVALKKMSGVWKRCTLPYKKQNGVWTQIEKIEAKEILKSRIIYPTLTFNNLVKNASFEDLSAWKQGKTSFFHYNPTSLVSVDTQSKYGSQSAKFYEIYTTDDDGNSTLAEGCNYIMQTLSIIANHKYYCRAWLKVSEETSKQISVELNDSTICTAIGYTDWTMISGQITLTNSSVSANLIFDFDAGGDIVAWLDGVTFIDLTDSFGEGNEPTKEWCDENIPFFECSWGKCLG